MEGFSLFSNGLSRQASNTAMRDRLHPPHISDHIVELRHLVGNVSLVFELGVYGHEIVGALPLHGVARIEEHGGVGVGHLAGESAEGVVHAALVEVLLSMTVVKPRRFSAAATSDASLLGLGSGVVFLYAELPITSATRLPRGTSAAVGAAGFG
jgi:hypothetical protein